MKARVIFDTCREGSFEHGAGQPASATAARRGAGVPKILHLVSSGLCPLVYSKVAAATTTLSYPVVRRLPVEKLFFICSM